jgi:uncharacterized protein YciU (UPF0263 family)
MLIEKQSRVNEQIDPHLHYEVFIKKAHKENKVLEDILEVELLLT